MSWVDVLFFIADFLMLLAVPESNKVSSNFVQLYFIGVFVFWGTFTLTLLYLRVKFIFILLHYENFMCAKIDFIKSVWGSTE